MHSVHSAHVHHLGSVDIEVKLVGTQLHKCSHDILPLKQQT